jgi:bifunctional enzyme CysN/CysC
LASANDRERIERHEVADCTLLLARPLAFDLADDLAATGRFVLVDDFEISGGGIIREAIPDSQSATRDKVLRRNLKWAAGAVGEERRAERLSQRAALVIITGDRESDRKRVGRDLESRLFEDGRFVYFLAISWRSATCCTVSTPISIGCTRTERSTSAASPRWRTSCWTLA